MNELTRVIQDEVPWCTLFTDNIVFIDMTRDGIHTKLKRSRNILKSTGFKLSKSKTTYLEYRFNKSERGVEAEETINGMTVKRVEKFRCLGSIIQEDTTKIEQKSLPHGCMELCVCQSKRLKFRR